MAIDEKHFQKEVPPDLWVITKVRARAGKPPFKIKPFGWEFNGESNRPWAVKANKSDRCPDGQIYALRECFISAKAAKDHLSVLIKEEIAYEERKLRGIKSRLKQSMDSALKLVDAANSNNTSF